jgi:DNA polymerase I-like protein with 3'-5' exonuclease and polymerase domains
VNAKDELHYHDGKLWGGSLTENIVQSTCRDYLGGWILNIEQMLHCPVVHHVYDETITMVPENQAEHYKKQIEAIMSAGPAWADDMPFKAESSISPFYKK